MGEEFWKLTQEELQGESDPLFSKPKLSEKLLQKPPFRFLHDIVTEIQKSTGFAQGLFRDEELDSKAVASDKESKAAYLSKIIQCVSHALGESVPAKPQKIMAGLEPENTNQFLRQLARAARQARGGDQGATAVRMVLGGEGAEPTPPPAEPARQPPEAPTEPAQAPPPSESKEDAAVTDGKHHSSARSAARSDSREGNRARDRERERREEKERERRERKEREHKEHKEHKEQEDEARAPPPALAGGQDHRPPTGGSRPGSVGPAMRRPQSARRGPPKAGSRPQDSVTRESLVPTEGPKVFTEGEDDDDEVEIVTEAEPVLTAAAPADASADGQGALVKDILSAQKQLAQDTLAGEEEEAGGTGIVLKRRGSSKGAAQPAAAKASDLGQLRASIQTLCQSAMPLGKSMDYLQEDLENMKKELSFWMNEYRIYQAKLAEQQRYQDNLLNPEASVADLDNQIQQAKERIKGMKAQVLRNDETINKLLSMVVSGSR